MTSLMAASAGVPCWAFAYERYAFQKRLVKLTTKSFKAHASVQRRPVRHPQENGENTHAVMEGNDREVDGLDGNPERPVALDGRPPARLDPSLRLAEAFTLEQRLAREEEREDAGRQDELVDGDAGDRGCCSSVDVRTSSLASKKEPGFLDSLLVTLEEKRIRSMPPYTRVIRGAKINPVETQIQGQCRPASRRKGAPSSMGHNTHHRMRIAGPSA